ncbi:hypothetical protein [Malaciobacter mytili]|uniref:hypothetical protein n=1 Tax=Malaciobacter mytili TaxID=603050 RepID=UPI003A8B8E83
MIKFSYSKIKNSEELNQRNIKKSKIKKYIFIFLLLFIGLNISNYFSEYKKYVLPAPQKLQEARKEFTKAYMFHLYYASFVRFFSIDFQNPILKIFKIPRDYFYQKALEKLPKDEGEKALYFELFEAKLYNFSVGGAYGSMARHYGINFSKKFIDKVYKNIRILSTQKLDKSFTDNIGRDVIEAYLGLTDIFVADSHLNPQGFIFNEINMKKYATNKELNQRFLNVYNWQNKFTSEYEKNYPKEYNQVLSKYRGWNSPYIYYYKKKWMLASFILFYFINNNLFNCEIDKRFLIERDSSLNTLIEYTQKNQIFELNKNILQKEISYLKIENKAKIQLFEGDNPLNLKINCKY